MNDKSGGPSDDPKNAKGTFPLSDSARIAAVVILYNPPPDVVDNIDRYRDNVGVIYAIDNSESGSTPVAAGLRTLANVVHIPNGNNLGVARALNMAAERAIREGYDFLLTMDQDGKAGPGMVPALLECAERTGKENIGIISPVHRYPYSLEGNPGRPCHEVLTAMTSGNLLSLKAYREAGPFQDDLFIDHVDDEYCLRLHLQGFKVVMAQNAVLEHRLGTASEHRLLGKRFGVSNHPPIRRYYEIRNRFYLRQRYDRHFRGFFRFFYLKLLREIATVVLYERDKWKKLRMMMKGYHDFTNGISGKYSGQ
jgi:rhamnosyltransferase